MNYIQFLLVLNTVKKTQPFAINIRERLTKEQCIKVAKDFNKRNGCYVLRSHNIYRSREMNWRFPREGSRFSRVIYLRY